jgi:hypothetical protein
MDKAIVKATRQVDAEIQFTRAGLARFRGGMVRIPLRVIDVTDVGSMTETHPDEAQTTRDYSKITPEFSESLMERVVDWLCEFIPRFEKLKITDVKKTYP